MVQLPLKSLIGKLNPVCHRALYDAVALTQSNTHYEVEVEHWLVKLMDASDTDLDAALRYCEVETSRLAKDLTMALGRLKRGSGSMPGLSPSLVNAIREAWLLSSIQYQTTQIRSGHLLCALLGDEILALRLKQNAPQLENVGLEDLRKALPDITASTSEAEAEVHTPGSGAPAVGDRPGGGGPTKTPSLDQFTVDLTARARKGQIDPVLGRDQEIRQVIDILTRRRQNNPILTGEAGVGKTAVVEGLALRLATGDVPLPLKSVSLRTLDLALLQAGAGVKGEFENRLKSVIEEVKSSPQPIVLFIDEAHTMIGAGGQAGQGDAANLLKPALARGELRTIAATTWAEYKQYFEEDAALARRFQVVKVEEPSEEAAVEMMRGLISTLEKHHKVRVLEEGVVDSVRFSSRYISGRQLPDKCVSLLDTACARVSLSQTATPPAIEDCRRRIEQLGVAIQFLEREAAVGTDHTERLAELQQSKRKAETEIQTLEARWKAEVRLVNEIRRARHQLESGLHLPSDDAKPTEPATPPPPLSPADRDRLLGELKRWTQELVTLQGESPLLQVCVDSAAVADVVSAWTGIPVGRMVKDEIHTVQELEKRMGKRIVGQDHALTAIAEQIRTARANMTDPRRPIGVFLMVGPSGVGKTETAIALTETLYGGDQNMTVINMSEFKEEHKVSLLMGAPPGYVGYGKGGVLTEAVRRKPYSVVLLDELEKAHPGVQDIFYQVFDKGMLRDSGGRDIDFKNTVIIMTSNAATDFIMKLCADPETRPDARGLAEALHEELLKTFKPAFLGRVTLVPYYPLTDAVLRSIVELQLGRIAGRILENYRARFTFGPELVTSIVQRCTEVSSGARNVDHLLRRTLLPDLSAEFLARLADGQAIRGVHVSVDDKGAFQYGVS